MIKKYNLYIYEKGEQVYIEGNNITKMFLIEIISYRIIQKTKVIYLGDKIIKNKKISKIFFSDVHIIKPHKAENNT